MYSPVCGTDGVKYANKCLFDKAKCTNPELAVATDKTSCQAKNPERELSEGGLDAEKDFCATFKGCNRMYSPVCGTDGVKYANKCLFDKAKCTNPELAVATDKTSCQAKHPERELSEQHGCIQSCHEIYQPVCGSDGQTYSNECSLKRESCLKGVKVEMKSPGRCAEEKKQNDERVLLDSDTIDDCPRACIEIFQPVCGTDGNTYANKCTLKQDACARKVSIQVAHEGDCDGKLKVSNLQADAPTQCPKGCPKIYHPVCGTDGKTYANECTLHLHACENKVDVAVAHDGKCDDNNTNVAAQPPANPTECRKGCPEIYHAVCGTDGKTYENECTLQRVACENKIDVAVAHDGDCEGRLPIKREIKECPVACIEILRPVCGSDGKTYDNECFLKRDACSKNVHVQVAHEGMCIVDE
ncbi:hypothetical protein AeMF1_021219 [Aphanomyces euteiches]|nr:hypothetical protein AeMF1_021219 [Aphanomyces euteiches]